MAYRSRAYSTEIERKASALKHSPEKEQEARDWIESVLGHGSFPRGNFKEALADGIILCELINVLQPGSVKKIHTGSMKFKMMENISHFLKGCEAYGLTKMDLFQTVDLIEGRNIPQVINTILALARASQKPTSSKSTSSRTYSSRQQDDYHSYDRQPYYEQPTRNYDRSYDQQTHSYDQQTHSYDQQTHNYDQQTYEDQLVTGSHDEDDEQPSAPDHDQQAYYEDDQETELTMHDSGQEEQDLNQEASHDSDQEL